MAKVSSFGVVIVSATAGFLSIACGPQVFTNTGSSGNSGGGGTPVPLGSFDAPGDTFITSNVQPLDPNTTYNQLHNNMPAVNQTDLDQPVVDAAGSAFRGFFASGTGKAFGGTTSDNAGNAISLTATNKTARLDTQADAAGPNDPGISANLFANQVGGGKIQPGSYSSTDPVNFQSLSLYNTLGTASLNGPPTNQVQLSYSFVGEYNQNNSNNGKVGYGAFSAGQQTTDMPATGQANYRGAFIGRDLTPSPLPDGFLNGEARATADFGTNKVTGTVTNITSQTYPGPVSAPAPFGLSFDGNITGPNFSGTAALTGAGATTTSTNGSAGGFYGPGAAEITGTLMAKGNAAGVDRTVIGGFATKKQ